LPSQAFRSLRTPPFGIFGWGKDSDGIGRGEPLVGYIVAALQSGASGRQRRISHVHGYGVVGGGSARLSTACPRSKPPFHPLHNTQPYRHGKAAKLGVSFHICTYSNDHARLLIVIGRKLARIEYPPSQDALPPPGYHLMLVYRPLNVPGKSSPPTGVVLPLLSSSTTSVVIGPFTLDQPCSERSGSKPFKGLNKANIETTPLTCRQPPLHIPLVSSPSTQRASAHAKLTSVGLDTLNRCLTSFMTFSPNGVDRR